MAQGTRRCARESRVDYLDAAAALGLAFAFFLATPGSAEFKSPDLVTVPSPAAAFAFAFAFDLPFAFALGLLPPPVELIKAQCKRCSFGGPVKHNPPGYLASISECHPSPLWGKILQSSIEFKFFEVKLVPVSGNLVTHSNSFKASNLRTVGSRTSTASNVPSFVTKGNTSFSRSICDAFFGSRISSNSLPPRDFRV